jgi:hypothetical protein
MTSYVSVVLKASMREEITTDFPSKIAINILNVVKNLKNIDSN